MHSKIDNPGQKPTSDEQRYVCSSQSPSVTVITVTKDNQQGLALTLDSIRSAKALASFEYIVVDGASTDGSLALIAQYVDCIDRWVSEPDTGVFSAMNKGARMANGDYLLYMNAGDLLLPDALPKAWACGLSTDVVYGDTVFTRQGRQVAHHRYPDILSMGYFFDCSINHQSTLIRRNLQLAVPYREDLRLAGDWHFFVQQLIFQGSSYAHIPVTIASYDTEGMSERQQEQLRAEREELLAKWLPEGVLKDYRQLHALERSGLLRYALRLLSLPVKRQRMACKLLSLLSKI